MKTGWRLQAKDGVPHFRLMTNGWLLRPLVRANCESYAYVARIDRGTVLPLRRPVFF